MKKSKLSKVIGIIALLLFLFVVIIIVVLSNREPDYSKLTFSDHSLSQNIFKIENGKQLSLKWL